MSYLNTFFILIAFALILLFSPSLHAESSGNIGFNFAQVIEDTALGVNGEYEYAGEGWNLEADALLQAQDVYRGKGNTEVTFDVSSVGIKLILQNRGKGYSLDTMGFDNNAFVALTVPTGDLNFDIGIGGKKASPWGTPNALNELVPKGYDESQLEALGLQNVFPAPRGLPFQDGTFLQTYISTGFSKGEVDIDLKGIVQITGKNKAHQVLTSFDTQKELFDNVSLNLGAEVILMSYQDEIHYETAWFAGVGYNW